MTTLGPVTWRCLVCTAHGTGQGEAHAKTHPVGHEPGGGGVSTATACEVCGYIHCSTDARAVGRFTGLRGYVAATAPTPIRETRAEAEADECAWRLRRPKRAPVPLPVTTRRAPEPAAEPEPVQPFPAVEMETAARAKAWRDFLAQVRMSLEVWQIDETVRENGEHVVAWVRRCRDDLDGALRADRDLFGRLA